MGLLSSWGARAPLVSERGLCAHGLQKLWRMRSVVVVLGLSPPEARVILLDQGSDQGPLRCKVTS